jgi:hypothetical protein
VVPAFKDLKKDIEACTERIMFSEAKLTRMTVKGRFLQYLGTKEQGDDELREDCIICMGSSDDTHAVLLECGHFFCNVSGVYGASLNLPSLASRSSEGQLRGGNVPHAVSIVSPLDT